MSFALINEATRSQTIHQVHLTGSDRSEFAITLDEASGEILSQGEAGLVHVAFQPTSPGTKQAVLQFETSAGPYQVLLAGGGMAHLLDAPLDWQGDKHQEHDFSGSESPVEVSEPIVRPHSSGVAHREGNCVWGRRLC